MRRKDTETVIRTVGIRTGRGANRKDAGEGGSSRDSEMKGQKGTNVKDK